MDRRGFLKALAGTVGGIALAEAIPFNRVWSFPQKVVPLNVAPITIAARQPGTILYYFADKKTGKRLTPDIRLTDYNVEFDHYLFSEDRWPDVKVITVEDVAHELRRPYNPGWRFDADRPRGELQLLSRERGRLASGL
jgi:hypothetical protein